MAAPAGNQFWKMRSKHGRDKLFQSPDLLWEAASEYFEWCDANPWIRKDWVGKDAKEVDRETPRPYTIEALCLYIGCNTSWFRNFRATATEDFSAVITRIEEIIRNQKFEGAMTGAYNANIVSRDLGLADKKEVTSQKTVRFRDAE